MIVCVWLNGPLNALVFVLCSVCVCDSSASRQTVFCASVASTLLADRTLILDDWTLKAAFLNIQCHVVMVKKKKPTSLVRHVHPLPWPWHTHCLLSVDLCYIRNTLLPALEPSIVMEVKLSAAKSSNMNKSPLGSGLRGCSHFSYVHVGGKKAMCLHFFFNTICPMLFCTSS